MCETISKKNIQFGNNTIFYIDNIHPNKPITDIHYLHPTDQNILNQYSTLEEYQINFFQSKNHIEEILNQDKDYITIHLFDNYTDDFFQTFSYKIFDKIYSKIILKNDIIDDIEYNHFLNVNLKKFISVLYNIIVTDQDYLRDDILTNVIKNLNINSKIGILWIKYVAQFNNFNINHIKIKHTIIYEEILKIYISILHHIFHKINYDSDIKIHYYNSYDKNFIYLKKNNKSHKDLIHLDDNNQDNDDLNHISFNFSDIFKKIYNLFF